MTEEKFDLSEFPQNIPYFTLILEDYNDKASSIYANSSHPFLYS